MLREVEAWVLVCWFMIVARIASERAGGSHGYSFRQKKRDSKIFLMH